MIDQIRKLADESLEVDFPSAEDGTQFTVGYVRGFIAGRTSAADAHLPSVEQIAEVLSAQTTCDGEPWPSELHRRQARAVRTLFGEAEE